MVTNNLEQQLSDINKEIDELEFALRICDSRIVYMQDIKKTEADKYITKNYETRIVQDTYKRMSMQDKLRKLMRDSMEIQDKICNNYD